MRILAIAAAVLGLAATTAHAQNPQQLLQGLLSGNQGQDQAVRDAFERGYRSGRQDQARDDRERFEGRGPATDDRRAPGYPPPGGYGR